MKEAGFEEFENKMFSQFQFLQWRTMQKLRSLPCKEQLLEKHNLKMTMSCDYKIHIKSPKKGVLKNH